MNILFHKCTTECPPEHSQMNKKRENRSLAIDFHCHILSPTVEKLVVDCPQKKGEPAFLLKMMGEESIAHNVKEMLPMAFRKMSSLEERLADMDIMGVDIQVLSPSPSQYYYWADADLAREIVNTQNEEIAAVCADNSERFIGLGNISLQHEELAVEQLTYAVKNLGLKGVEISTNVNGLDLHHPKFEKFWTKADELNCVVFIHPLGTSLGERVNQFYLTNIIGQPLETTIALSSLIFNGTLDRYPNLKILAAHGGGYLPYYIGRSNHGYKVRPEAAKIKKKPSEYLKQIYYDNLVYSPEILRDLIDLVGVSQIVVGTDYPFDMGDYDVHDLVENVEGLSEAEREMILNGNAIRLLGLETI